MTFHLCHQKSSSNTVNLNVPVVSSDKNVSFWLALVSFEYQYFVRVNLLICVFLNFTVVNYVPKLRENCAAAADPIFTTALFLTDLPNADLTIVAPAN